MTGAVFGDVGGHRLLCRAAVAAAAAAAAAVAVAVAVAVAAEVSLFEEVCVEVSQVNYLGISQPNCRGR